MRCAAVLLVLARHANTRTFLANVGWAGVDLFFVLSGFLISGLLFTEYKTRGSIDFRRFFIRRGLKLYPAFYVLLAVTVIVRQALHQTNSLAGYLHEIFYVQNYFYGVWDHTWTLAVEEHFYILLPIFLLVLIRFSSDRANPFRAIPLAFLLVAITCLALRIIRVRAIPAEQMPFLFGKVVDPTQNRMDSLFFGVLLGYIYHFKPHYLKVFQSRWIASALLILASMLLSSCFFAPMTSRFMLTVGFTLVYLGFGILLIVCLQTHGMLPAALLRPAEQIGSGFAYVGMYSYSIYLWHLAVNQWFVGFVHRYLHVAMGPHRRDALYLVVSILFGIAMSRLIEYPVLRLRDRMFPQFVSPIDAGTTPSKLSVGWLGNSSPSK